MGATTVEELEIIVSAKIEQVKPQIRKVVQEIKNAVKETDGIGQKIIGRIDTQKISNEAAKVKEKIDKMFDPSDTSGMKINGKRIISGVSEVFDALKGKQIDLGNAVELNNYKNKLSQAKNVAKEAKQEISKVGHVKYNESEIRKLVDNYKKGSSEAEKMDKQIKKSSDSANKLSKNTSKIKGHLASARSGTSGLNLGFNNARKFAKKMTSHLKVGLGQIIKMAGALFGLRNIYNILRNTANAWLGSQNTQAQQLSANIEYMKYALGSALAPVIETIVNLIYQALKGVQSLIYALTGVNIFANASAKAYASMANSAKDTQKSMQGVADIDEIHNIQQDNGSSGGIAPDFDLSGIETADWAQKLIDNIKDGNWYELGSTVSEKINETLEKIPWNKIKQTSENVGKNLGEFINGGVKNTNWSLVGGTIAEGVNTAFRFLKGFLETTDFRELRKSFNGNYKRSH